MVRIDRDQDVGGVGVDEVGVVTLLHVEEQRWVVQEPAIHAHTTRVGSVKL